MSRQLVLIGGGHARMVTLQNIHKFIERGHHVTLIGPSEYHYYSGMGPGLLSQIYSAQETRFAIRKMVEKHGGTFIRDSVTQLDPHRRLVITRQGRRYSCDLLSCNTGSYGPPGEKGETTAPFSMRKRSS